MAFASQQKQQQPVQESNVTRLVEEQTGKIPSIGYLGFAVGSMAVSAALAFLLRKRELANFVGLWAPSILILGVYGKLMRLEHEDLERQDGQHREFGQSRDYQGVGKSAAV